MISRRILPFLVVLCCPAAAFACAACFGAPDAAQTQGMNNAILLLLGVTTTVIGGGGAVVARILRSEGQTPALPAPPATAASTPDEDPTP